MSTVKEMQNKEKKLQGMSKVREGALPSMPINRDQFETPEMVDMFKMISVLQFGSSGNWELIRQEYIKKRMNAPTKEKTQAINARLVSEIQSKNFNQEDIIMNDMNLDTNDIINQISAGTIDIDDGSKELEKMKMVEGDMPGQGKQKQGNWRG